MNDNQPIFWHQGLFLQPQHFQHGDALRQQELARLVELTQPHAWGIASMEIEEPALATLRLAVSQVSLRFRDGTLVEYPGNAILEPRSFDLERLGDGRTAYLGLRRESPDQPSVLEFESLAEAGRAESRLAVAADAQMLPDRYTGGPSARVKLMSYVLRIFWEDELDQLDHYELVPLARLEQDGDIARLSRNFVPPSLSLAAAPGLLQIVRQVRDELVGRARQLDVFKPVSGAAMQTGEADPGQAGLLLALSVLNRHGPKLQHLIEAAQTHPWQAYGALRQLVGELSTFSERYNMLGETRDGRALVPTYRHDDPSAGFGALAMLVRTLLNEIAAAPEMMVSLLPGGAGQGFLQNELPDGFFGLRHRYHLVVRGDLDPVGTAANLPRDAKLGAPDVIETLVIRSLPGVELIHLPDPPRGMPRRPGALYFRIDPLSDAWDAVEAARAVALFLPGAPMDLQAELIVTKW